MNSSHERAPWLPLWSMSPYFSPLMYLSSIVSIECKNNPSLIFAMSPYTIFMTVLEFYSEHCSPGELDESSFLCQSDISKNFSHLNISLIDNVIKN